MDAKTFRDKDQAAIMETTPYQSNEGLAVEFFIGTTPEDDPDSRWASARLNEDRVRELRDHLTDILNELGRS